MTHEYMKHNTQNTRGMGICLHQEALFYVIGKKQCLQKVVALTYWMHIFLLKLLFCEVQNIN